MSYLQTKNQFITVNGQQIAYREVGQGKSELPLVMLVHLAATMDNWDPKLIDLLAEKQHLILMDLPGVGASEGKVADSVPGMARQSIAIIKALGYSKVNLLGLSMGGFVAQEVVREDQTLVNTLTLVGTGPRAGIGVNKVTSTTFGYMARAALHRVDPKRYIFYNHDAQGKIEADKVLDRLTSRPKETADAEIAVPSFLAQLKAIKKWGKAEPDSLAHITMPTLIVNGDDDRMVPTQNSYDMHAKIKHSQLIIYQNAGHGSLFQYADQFTSDLQAFLAKEW